MELKKQFTRIIAAIIALLVASSCVQRLSTHEDIESEETAKSYGWLPELRRGKEIVQKLSGMNFKELREIDLTAYRGEKVAFIAGTAPPGGTNDLVTEDGFYLRIVNPQGKDLRPRAVWWEVIICGKILQVKAENKIIIIEVDEKDWKVIQTG